MSTLPGLVAFDSLHTQVMAGIRRSVETSDIDRIVVARADGMVIAHNLKDPVVAKRLGAMSAAILGVATAAMSQLQRGDIREVTVDADGGRMACLQAGPNALVAGMFPERSNIGLVLLTLRRLASEIETSVGARSVER